MKRLLLLFLILLFIGCSKPPDPNKENKTVFRLGANGNTFFENICSTKPVKLGDKEYYTKYGHGEVIFYIEGDRVSFAIFSVPADVDTEVYFNFRIESENESSPNFVICSYSEENNGRFSIFVDNEQKAIPYLVSGKASTHLVRVSGIFERFKQENFVVLGTDSLLSNERKEDIISFVNRKSKDDKVLEQENSAYIIAYPWREIRVAFFRETLIRAGNPSGPPIYGKEDTTIETSTLNFLNSVFAQAICSIKVVDPNTEDFDVEIIFSNLISVNAHTGPSVTFYDERSMVFDIFNSNSLKFAKLCTKGYSDRRLAYAIAYLLGVSLIEDEVGEEREGNDTRIRNLMDTTSDGTHLSFRQWNQLQMRNKR